MDHSKQKLVVIIGPTAVGKTSLSIQLAKHFHGEIISGDSMQIYKKMNIGTAKIKPTEMEGVPHHLIDIKEPDESFSVAEFQKETRSLIEDISAKGHLPMIVGGTGLYIQSVVYDYQFSSAPSDKKYREDLENRATEEGNNTLYEELKQIDPIAASNIHVNNLRRIIRGLEIYHCTGLTMTDYIKSQDQELLYDVTIIGLTMERESLYKRIDCRVDLMMRDGLLEEVESLYKDGYQECQSMKAIGYKEFFPFFSGESSLDEVIEELKRNSRRYAKRQLTWFRNKMPVTWFDMTPPINQVEKQKEIFRYLAGELNLSTNN
ncbi:tRNA (adenosine(37)-N6)-dimethylallyltransferase MiaA [Bacillus carboniphilus]|uniref:tRNA dimethylallyltransferase n=1 Tax=Bacillus carboniphilus TaxID=86663 RepID=A0ABY9JVM9_9BACI|nr:tRNA (adenosine(37)-N6)-dimethylallyltransferase MiaA [Bacillus carboniphilus]WLR43466.1 tRNA (adenosine(37)-N6)-dimethylallyltransferase MiaA [Bacillus carboniphilus]